MTAEQKQQWVAALRSGEWQQGMGTLHNEFDGKTTHCCLGVADVLFGLKSRSTTYLASTAGISPSSAMFLNMMDQSTLVSANDSGKTFAEIADIIERDIQPTE